MIPPPPRPHPAPHSGIAGALFLVLLACLLPACQLWRPPPTDLSQPGWSIHHGQAVWHPAKRDIELAGDLLLATHPDGQAYLLFGKGPVALAEARADSNHWLARFPTPGRTFSGAGNPPARLAWNQLLRIALGLPPAPGWTWSGSLDHRWRLAHADSGEWLEGAATP